MTKVMVGLAVSVDGFIAGLGDGGAKPLGEGGEALFGWYFDGDTPSRTQPRFRLPWASAALFDAMVESTGAMITGRRTYDISNAWGGDSPVPGRPLFIMTHRPPSPTPPTKVPHTFVTDGVQSAIAQAREVAGGRDVSLAGAQPAQQALRAGLLDELHLAVVPVLLGGGVRLLDHLGGPVRLDKIAVVDTPMVTHLAYRVRKD
jgi:dihydrofolate reductase